MTQVLRDVSIWGFWREGWLVIPCVLGYDENDDAPDGTAYMKQAATRFPQLRKSYGRLCHRGHRDCIAYKSVKVPGSEPPASLLVYQDMRLPSTPGDYGLIMFPVDEDGKKTQTSWERFQQSFRFLTKTLRQSLVGTFYLPVEKRDDFHDELLEEVVEELRDTQGVVLLTGEARDNLPWVPISNETSTAVPVFSQTAEVFSTTEQATSAPQPAVPQAPVSLIAHEFEVAPRKRAEKSP